MTKHIGLIGGDLIAIVVVTILGFASHGTATSAGARMLTTFIPLAVAWFLIAPFLGLYDPLRAADARQLWRPVLAMAFAGPFAAWLRGVMLGAPILPLFVAVLGGSAALGMFVWRFLYWLAVSRRSPDRPVTAREESGA